MTNIFWAFEFEDKPYDIECESKEAARQAADDWWHERCENEGFKNGDVCEDFCLIKSFQYNDDAEKLQLSSTKYRLYYQCYHGDFTEHNTLGR